MRSLLLTALIVPLLINAAHAQSTGTLRGTVVDADGTTVIGATVVIDDRAFGASSEPPDGSFIIVGIPAGDHRVTVSFIGFATEVSTVTIVSGRIATLVVRLVASDRAGDTVTVHGSRLDNGGESIQSISGERLRRAGDPDVIDAVTRTTSASAQQGGVSVRGSRATDVEISVDGASVIDPQTGGLSSLPSELHPSPSTLAIEAVDVVASGGDAAVGRTLGGNIAMTTRSGDPGHLSGDFRFQAPISILGGWSDPITVHRPGSSVDTTLDPVRSSGSGRMIVDFALGGPVPFVHGLTFFVSGKYDYRRYTNAEYDVYDMSQEYADARRQRALRAWGFALEPMNIGQVPHEESMVRNVLGNFKYELPWRAILVVSAEYGWTSRELGGWDGAYMFDHPVEFARSLSGEVNYGDTLRVNRSLLERDVQQSDENVSVQRITTRYSDELSASTLFEISGSWVRNHTQIGKKDETLSYGVFDSYDIPEITDIDGNGIIDTYEASAGRSPLNEFADPERAPSIQLRNPVTGFYEGARTAGAGRNPFGLVDGTFAVHGNDRLLEERESETVSLTASVETNVTLGSVAAQLRTGGEVNFYTLRRHQNSLPWNSRPFFDIYGYDGATYFGSDSVGRAMAAFLADPYHPVDGAVWLQSRFEYRNVTVQPGVRFDFSDPNSLRAPVERQRVVDVVNGLSQSNDASVKVQVSPRVSVSYPVTDRSRFRVNFAMMFDMPAYNLLYDNAFGSAQRGNQVFGDPDIDPQRVFNYELGFRSEFATATTFDITAFYRDIFNQSGVRYVPAVPGSYVIYDVQDYGNVRGLEVSLERRVTDHIGFNLGYTLQRAMGTASSPGANYATAISGVDPYTGRKQGVPLAEFPLSYDRTHRFNAEVTMAWGTSEGPTIGGVALLENTMLQLRAAYGSGLPYTRFNAKGQQTGEYNGERLPSRLSTDLHVSRRFSLGGLLGASFRRVQLELFADVANLLNLTGPTGVFATTGSPDQNGTSLDRRIGDFVSTAWYGEIDPARPETFAASQYDRYGTRWYNPYADVNLDGVETQSEKYAAYQRFVATYQSLRRNYQSPRTVTAGLAVHF